jgi:hypothetical protein
MEIVVIGVVVVFVLLVIWGGRLYIDNILDFFRDEAAEKRKKDEPKYEPPKYEPKNETGDWQKEFSDIQSVIKENIRKDEEAKQVRISQINHIRNQFCPNIEKVLMEFAKSINGNYQEVLVDTSHIYSYCISCYCVKCYVPSKSHESDIFIHLCWERILISYRVAIGSDDMENCVHIHLNEFSNVKFANELKSFYLGDMV